MTSATALASAVHECLGTFGFPIIGGTPYDIRFICRTQAGKEYRAQILVATSGDLIRIFLHFDTEYSLSRLEWMSEYVHRLNCEVGVLGGFGMHPDTGGIFFRYGLDLRDQPSNPQTIARALNTCSFGLDVFEAGRPFITSARKVSPATVVSTAMLLVGATHEDAFVSKEAKKLAFRLIK